MLRLITDGKLSPEEAVRAYHGVLQGKGIAPLRALDEDLQLTDQAMSYDGSATRRAKVEVRDNPVPSAKPARRAEPGKPPLDTPERSDWPKHPDGTPDFAAMTSAQRLAYDAGRLMQRFG